MLLNKKVLCVLLVVGFLGCQRECFAVIESTAVPERFPANGSATTFNFTFRLTAQTEMSALVRADSTGVDTPLTLNVGYTLSATNNDFSSGGTLTTAATYASGNTLILERDTSRTQTVNLIQGQSLPAEATETTFDKQTMAIQDIDKDLGFTITVPHGDPTTALSLVLPSSIDRAGKNMTFDETGSVTATDQLSTGSADISAFGATLIDDSNDTAALNTLGIGTADSPTWAGVTITGAATVGTSFTVGTTLGVTGAVTMGTTLGVTGLITGTDLTLSEAATPTVTVTDTTNTITSFLSANDTSGEVGTSTAHGFALVTNATTKAFIESGGNIGVGTTTPFSGWNTTPTPGIHISGTAGGIGFTDTDLGDRYLIINSSGNFRVRNDTDDMIRLSLNGDGDFAVGMESIGASHRLDVLDDVASDYVARFSNDGANANRFGIIIQAGDDTDGGGDQTIYVQAYDGDGDSLGIIEQNTSNNFVITTASDARLKRDVEDTKIKGLVMIRDMQVRDYKKLAGDKVSTGFIAQEMAVIYPDAVSVLNPNDPNNPEMFGVSYSTLIPVLVKAYQELAAKVEVLENAP